MEKGAICIEIVEDNPTASDLLREYLKSGTTEVAAVYASGEEALDQIGRTSRLPDIVLMDIHLPGISGIETTRRLKAKHPGVEIIMLTIYEDSPTIIEAIKAGASGYLLKGTAKNDLLTASREVLNGGSFLTGKVARRVLQEFQAFPDGKAYGLTEREEEILKELIKGDAYKEIARKFSLSVHTVNNHIRRIYEKMQVHSRGEATAKLNHPP
ncbi:MAG: response regulator transcription factor [Deltaproteobacteria bacterium]|nr:response regulator transcription factor [Deltaproteobacteria bacterium]